LSQSKLRKKEVEKMKKKGKEVRKKKEVEKMKKKGKETRKEENI